MEEGINSSINNNTDDDFVVDRISDLPDSILGHILSFLPTDNAVATSILSKRWKFSWVSVHILDFTFFFKKHTKVEIMEFARFVNRVLLLHDGGLLNKFSLTCHHVLSISPHVISWINTAITRNVLDLYLYVEDIDMPASLFSCHSLRTLDLYTGGVISIYGSSVVSLSRLVTLKIHRVRFESEEACQKLIAGCPILQYLKLMIVRFGGDVITCVMISSASLRRLEIFFCHLSKLKLKASSLEYLRLFGRISEISVDRSMTSLVQADFKISSNEHHIPNNSIVEAVRAFDCAKYLTLSTDVMQALSCATIGLSTKFNRLVKLVACAYCCALQDFIQISENLEDLEIYSNSVCPGSSRWTTPVQVPACLSNSLKRVQLDYKCLEDAREMVHYILEHGSALEVMEIVSSVKEDGEKLLQEIRELPTKSPACKVQFCSSSRTNSR